MFYFEENMTPKDTFEVFMCTVGLLGLVGILGMTFLGGDHTDGKKAPKEDNPAANVAKLVKESKVATVATIYKKKMPFGSLMPYAIDDKGRPIVLISTLAVHTDNIEAHKESSFTISQIDKDNVFNSARVCLMGETAKVPDKELKAAKNLFLKKYPKAAFWADFEDFGFYRLEVKEIFYVGGFGKIHWIEVKDYVNEI